MVPLLTFGQHLAPLSVYPELQEYPQEPPLHVAVAPPPLGTLHAPQLAL